MIISEEIWKAHPIRVFCRGRIFTPRLDRNGYLAVDIRLLGETHKYSAHRLILETFVGPRPDGMVCRHFPDADKTNNRLENIQWGTQEENRADSLIHGTIACGERNGKSVLTKAGTEKAAAMRKSGLTHREIAEKLNVGRSTITALLNGRSYRGI
jgi:hypothetical protein